MGEEDIAKIEIIEEFTDDSWNYIQNFTFGALFNRLEFIKKELNTNWFSINNKSGLWVRNKDYSPLKKERELMFEAYEIIQAIRTKITGEMLSYELFLTTSKNEVYRIQVGADKISTIIGYHKKALNINMSLKKMQEFLNTDDKINPNELFTRKYQMVMKHFRKGDRDKNAFLVNTDNSPPPERKQQPNGKWAIYNKGHILEALSKTIDNMQNNELIELQDLSDVDFLWKFSEQLQGDSVSGFAGGDKGMVQIKANSARLMRYSSIRNAIDAVLLIRDKKNVEDIATQVRKIYENSGANGSINKIADKDIEKIANELLKNLTQ